MANSTSITPARTAPLATGLGWFSLALGTAQLVAGRSIAGWLGTDSNVAVRLFYGARELGVGAAILRSPRPTPWLWARVCGDALDVFAALADPKK